ncbi:type IV secretion system protein [Phenylobacterium sp.]|jgi:type IV secretion system protein VirB6|uniref:type IV secretion system protein n=1 Tax=Phenylobacterium sp. TaxID=1871053 RepID=UPI002F3E8C3C
MVSCSSMVSDGVIRGVLGAVDCQTRAFAETGYSSLTSASSGFQVALTALLTIYVALVGWRMLFASNGARLSDAPGIALKIGAILALVTSWANFQTLVFDLAARAPGEISAAIAAPLQSNSALAADPVGGLQAAYDQLTRSAVAFGGAAGPNAKPYASPAASAADALSAASGAMFMTTAGVIAAATLAIGVLTAVGPVFIALFLIPATRGFFVGWVRALGAAALTLMLGWLGVVLLLSVLQPWLVALAEEQRAGVLHTQTATSAAALVAVFAAGQVALLIAACVMAFAFRLRGRAEGVGRRVAATSAPDRTILTPEPSRAQRLAFDLQRDSGQAISRDRTIQLAAATVSAGRPAAETKSPTRLGDDYRRPAVTARRLKVSR